MSDLMKPVNFENVVREKVKQVIFDSMPEEQIDNLIKKEFSAYFDDPKDNWGRPNGEKSEFRKFVFKEMADAMRPTIIAAVDEFLKSKLHPDKETLDTGTQDWRQKFSDDFIDQMAPVVWRSITQDLITTAFSHFRNNLTRGY